MGLFYRLLGVAALFHHVCRSIYVYHIIRIDWIVVAALSLYSFAGASALGLPWPKFPLEVPMAYPVLQMSFAISVLAPPADLRRTTGYDLPADEYHRPG